MNTHAHPPGAESRRGAAHGSWRFTIGPPNHPRAVMMENFGQSAQAATGIEAGQGSTVSHCSARANTSPSSQSFGIMALTGSTVIACTVEGKTTTAGTSTGSTGGGIFVTTGVSVFDCTVRSNRGDGIQATNSCHLRGNHCANNGNGGDGAGIHLTSTDSRVEGNMVSFNDRGFDIDLPGNLIVRNTATGNTPNYDIAANNSVGPIVVTPVSVAISGDTGGAGVGSTDPWANFSY